MSCLAGYWDFGGIREPAEQCARQLDAQSRFGEEPQSWVRGALCLGRRKSNFLPEDRWDVGPVVRGSGRFVLVADVRLDNREELGRSLLVDQQSLARISDASLLTDCLIRWGEDALQRMVGDFAFAFWDSQQGSLMLGRDFVGHKPLHFTFNPKFFAFASMPRGLHALDGMSRRPSERAAVRFMRADIQSPGDSYFEDVSQVPPGHLVEVSRSKLERRRWWRFQGSQICSKTAAEASEQARHLLDLSVDARLRRSSGKASSHLSGGLDSTGVAATAAAQLAKSGDKLFCFTAVPGSGDLEIPRGVIAHEQAQARIVAEMYPSIEHISVSQGTSLIEVFHRNVSLWERPVPNPYNDLWWSNISSAAAARGAKILLTGPMGNIGLSYAGDELLIGLLRSFKFATFARTIFDTVRTRDASFRTMAASVIRASVGPSRWGSIQRIRGHPKAGLFLTPGAQANLDTPPTTTLSRCPLGRRLQIIASTDPGVFYAGAAGAWDIELRDPLADRWLLEFTLGLPPEQFWNGGRRRALARRALSDRLPGKITCEARKGFQAADWYLTLRRERDPLIAETEAIQRSSIGPLIDTKRILDLLYDLPSEGWASTRAQQVYGHQLIQAISTGHFLRSRG